MGSFAGKMGGVIGAEHEHNKLVIVASCTKYMIDIPGTGSTKPGDG